MNSTTYKGIWNKNNIRYCQICGNILRPGSKLFCSYKCHGISQKETSKGENNSNFGNHKPKKNISRSYLMRIYGFTEISKNITGQVKELILKNNTISEIIKQTGLSSYLINKMVLENFVELKSILSKNNYKASHCGSKKGGSTRLKGKSYLEIFGSVEKAQERAKITSDWMKTEKNIRRFCDSPSKPQKELFEFIKTIKPQAVLEYPIKLPTKIIWLDIAIPDEKIDIEYDGEYWHKLNNSKNVFNDEKRDNILVSLGWKIIRTSETKITYPFGE